MSKRWLSLVVIAVAVVGFVAGLVGAKQGVKHLSPETVLLAQVMQRMQQEEGALVSLPVIAAEGYILADAEGTGRAALRMIDGAPTLSLYDEQQQGGVSLTVPGPGQPMLVFYDAQHVARVLLRLVEEDSALGLVDGNPALELRDAQGVCRTVIGLVEGEPHCTFYNSEREVIGSQTVDQIWQGRDMPLEGEE